MQTFDVIVVGGGPAGLSAALVLGRSCRRVLVCDAGNPRNSPSDAMHGFLSRDGMHPGEFLKIARDQLVPYGVELLDTTVTQIDWREAERHFEVRLIDDTVRHSRKVLLATGVVDHVPALEGIVPLYGKSVHHCPYCDGWEYRGQPTAVYGKGKGGLALALRMRTWTEDVVLCTDGPAELEAAELERLLRHGVRVRSEKIGRLEGTGTQLEAVVFENGDRLLRRAMFFSTGNEQRSHLPTQLGCVVNEKGAVTMDKKQHTNVRGVYVAGDACYDSQYVIIAAGEGAKAAMSLDQELEAEERV